MTNFKEQLGNLIHKAEAELDELRVKIALGKMNGADLFEDMKHEFRNTFHELRGELHQNTSHATDILKQKVEELQVQLALGKAEAIEEYEEQQKKINRTISEMEHIVKDGRTEVIPSLKIRIQNELEKFRLKMEVLKIRYELGRLDLKGDVENQKQKFKKELESLLDNLKDEAPEKLEEYGSSLKNAYDSLRKSLQ